MDLSTLGGGGGLPVNSLVPIYEQKDKFEQDGLVWLRTGVLDTDVEEYPNALKTRAALRDKAITPVSIPTTQGPGTIGDNYSFAYEVSYRRLYRGNKDWTGMTIIISDFGSVIYNPFDIAAQLDDVWLCGQTETKIFKFSSNGSYLTSITVGTGCTGLCFDGVHLWGWFSAEKKLKQINPNIGLTGVQYDLTHLTISGNSLSYTGNSFLIAAKFEYVPATGHYSYFTPEKNTENDTPRSLITDGFGRFWGKGQTKVDVYDLIPAVGYQTKIKNIETQQDYFIRIK